MWMVGIERVAALEIEARRQEAERERMAQMAVQSTAEDSRRLGAPFASRLARWATAIRRVDGKTKRGAGGLARCCEGACCP